MDVKKLSGLLGILAGTSMPEEAEGAVRPDILDVVKKAIAGQKYGGSKAGTLDSTNAATALENSAKYGGNYGYLNNHGLVQRFQKDGWTPEQIAEGYRGIYDSPDTVLIPNVLGKNPVAKEALWNPAGRQDRSWYMPVLPYKRGFQTVTMYDPKTSKVEHLLKERGYWEGGPNSSIFSPSLMKVPAEQVGSGPISAVSTPFENTLQEQLKKLKLKAPAMAGAGTGAGLALWPADAPGYVNRNSAGEMPYLNDGKDVVSPFSGGSNGDVMLRTVFQPDHEKRKFVEGYLGRPLSPISGIRTDGPASAQPPGLSAVRQPSMEKIMPETAASGKSKLPVVAGAGSGAGLALWPADAPGYVNREPGLEEAWNPAELPAAVVGVPGLAGKAATAVLDPVLSYGMNQLGGLLDYFMREKE